MAEDIEKCDGPADPHRCQSVNSKGQCNNKGVRLAENTYGGFCRVHGGNKTQESFEAKKVRNYRLTKFQAQLERQTDSSAIKSLREEIGILRMIMEEKLNSCTDMAGLLLESQQISDLVLKIEKLVVSCHRLEGSLGQTLDKQAILQFASEIITIISTKLQGQEDLIEEIANEIVAVVGRIGGEGK